MNAGCPAPAWPGSLYKGTPIAIVPPPLLHSLGLCLPARSTAQLDSVAATSRYPVPVLPQGKQGAGISGNAGWGP